MSEYQSEDRNLALDSIRVTEAAALASARLIGHGDEKAAWWDRARQVWPDYDAYQAGTDRVIPLFVLEPEG